MITIITLADERYLSYLKVLVKSAAENFPEAKLYCVLVNTKEDIPGCEIEHVDSLLQGHELECFCTNARASLLKKLRKTREGMLIWMDATTIIRKPCSGLVQIAKKHDVCTRQKPDGKRWAGLLCVNDTEGGDRFIEEYDRLVSKDVAWYSNQDALDCCSSMGVSFGNLPEKYLDYKFNDSVIWTGKGRKVREDERWKAEMDKWGVKWENGGSDPVSKTAKFAHKDELKYWKKKKGRIKDRGSRLAKLFDEYVSGDFETVVDVGCGPRCGIFQEKTFPKMVAIDPLWGKYKKNGLAEIPEGVETVTAFADSFDAPADLIVSFNSLDHSGSIEKSIGNIMGNLSGGGLFFLHVHMRTSSQLDGIHTMILTEGMLDNLFEGHTILRRFVYDEDILYDKKAPRTYVALVEK